MTKNVKKNVTVNYNGEELKDDEVLVLTPYDDMDAEVNVTHKENIVTVTKVGVSVKAVLKAVPKAYAGVARSQFNAWQRDFLPKETEGRCLIPQEDGTEKECPKKDGNNRVSCDQCPYRGKYKKKLIAKVSLDQQQDENELSLATSPAADAGILAEENLTESQKTFVKKSMGLIDKSPKHGLAMMLMSLGVKGEAFAEAMHMSKPGANYVREQVMGMAPDKIDAFDQVDVDGLKASKSSDAEYYRTEAMKLLTTVIDMYFDC